MASANDPFSSFKRLPWTAWLRFVLVFAPAWVLLALVTQNATNIPVWDGWERALLLQKWDAGSLTFSDLYAPHIDHRIVFPRLLSLLVAEVAQGDLKWEIGASWLFGFGAGLGIWMLARRTLGPGLWTSGIAFLANLWIFSPLQYDNWLWPIQTAYLLPMTCLVWALVAATHPRWHWGLRCGIAAALAIVGTHSFSHGLFIWPAVFFLVLLMPKGEPGGAGKWAFALTWLAIAAVIVGCYFGIDYKVATEYSYSQQKGEATPMVAFWKEAVADSGRMWEFFLGILGGPLVRQFSVDPLPPAKWAGLASLVGYAICGLWALWQARRNPETWRRILPWLALGGAVIAIAFGASVGRSAILAGARAVVPRFLSISLYLPFTFLAVILLQWKSVREKTSETAILRTRTTTFGFVFLGMLIALQAQPWLYGAKLMQIWRISRLQAQARVQFIEQFQPDPSRVLAYTWPEVQRFAPILDELGTLDPPLVDSLALDQFSTSNKTLPVSKGRFQSAEPIGDSGKLELKGYAIMRHPSRPADAVFVTVESDGEPAPQIIGIADFDGALLPTRYRIDLQFSAMLELLESDPGSWMRWRQVIDPATLPSGRPLTIRIWAYDQTKRKAYPLAPRLILNADGTATLVELET
ncbi:MAG: hypothetical protein KDN19_07175 [Verrucomicrobiae bacterium]|nr:hypothetical protein [Verrucomicrobiae bacterium]